MTRTGGRNLVQASQRPGSALAALEARYSRSRQTLATEPGAVDVLFDRAEERRAHTRSPIRMIHHMACTGGTLIARGLQAQPNALVLSEIDPLSTIQMRTQRSKFAPTDPILLARAGLSSIADEVAVDMFRASIEVLHARLHRQGRRLVLRGHAHSHFCTETNWEQRPTLIEMFADRVETLSVLTVRHPIDSWLGLRSNNWGHFEPHTPEEYAKRYLAFLDRHESVPVFRYESFVTDPDSEMRGLCHALDMRYNQDWRSLISIIRLSGDSGRGGDTIAPRTRRELSEAAKREVSESPSFIELCARLGYDNV